MNDSIHQTIMPRPYTGTTDGPATCEGPGLRVLINHLLKKYPALWDNGTWGIRDQRGRIGTLSTHATGRAVDLSYRNMRNGKGIPFGGRKQAVACADWLVENADILGIEMILDYWPKPWGRGWKCTRNGWTIYTSLEIHGSPGGDWLHVEVAPTQANSAILMRQALTRVSDGK